MRKSRRIHAIALLILLFSCTEEQQNIVGNIYANDKILMMETEPPRALDFRFEGINGEGEVSWAEFGNLGDDGNYAAHVPNDRGINTIKLMLDLPLLGRIENAPDLKIQRALVRTVLHNSLDHSHNRQVINIRSVGIILAVNQDLPDGTEVKLTWSDGSDKTKILNNWAYFYRPEEELKDVKMHIEERRLILNNIDGDYLWK